MMLNKLTVFQVFRLLDFLVFSILWVYIFYIHIFLIRLFFLNSKNINLFNYII